MRLLRSPALHFLLIGGVLFAAALQQGAVGSFAERPRLVIPSSRINRARQQFGIERGRPPTPEEEKEIIDKLVDQEVLYQYALRLGLQNQRVAQQRLAMIAAFVGERSDEGRSRAELARTAVDLGLHQRDLVVRRILIDGARRLIRAVMLVRRPTDEMLEGYLRRNGDLFSIPEMTRITQITVNRWKHGAATEERALDLVEKLRRGGADPKDAVSLGDKGIVPESLPFLTDSDLTRRFGHQFTDRLKSLAPGTWTGPIESRYGLHAVYVHERKDAYVPSLAQIRDKVRHHFLQELADEWLALRLGQLRAEFEIVLPVSSS